MKKTLLLTLKGFIIGLANIIPGVSGGTLAIILGVYERLIDILSAIWKNFVSNLKFILPLLFGAAIAIIGGSFVIDWSLGKFPIATTMLFIGLIIGGIPFIYKKVHKKYNVVNIIIFIITAAIVVFFAIFTKDRNVDFSKLSFWFIIKLIGVGAIAAATMIIPGISGSMVMMNLGYYEGIISSIKGLVDFSSFWHNVGILFPFGIGVILGLFLIAKLIKFLLNKIPTQSYFAILAFVLASIFAIAYQIDASFNVLEFIIGLLLLIGGAVLTFFIARYDSKHENDDKIEPEDKKIETIE